jgi:hypothetical protein
MGRRVDLEKTVARAVSRAILGAVKILSSDFVKQRLIDSSNSRSIEDLA